MGGMQDTLNFPPFFVMLITIILRACLGGSATAIECKLAMSLIRADCVAEEV